MGNAIRLRASAFPGIPRPGLLAELMMVAHSIQKSAMEQLLQEGRYKKLSAAYSDYVSRLADRDYSPGELADELGVSKQLCSQVIRELECQKLIERRPNPRDSRSTLLSLGAEGRQLIRDGGRAADVILRQLEDDIGTGHLQQLTEVLEKLCCGLMLRVPAAEGAVVSKRLNTLLPVLAEYTRDRLSAAVWKEGYDRIGTSAGQVFGLISHEAFRIRHIAAILGISKQAVAQAGAELDRLGYVTRQPDPADGRQLIWRLSPRGEQVVAAGVEGMKSIEESFKACLTSAEYRLLQDSIATLYVRVAKIYDSAQELPNKIDLLADQLLAELGPAGARALAQYLRTLTRGKL
jgi:DNA-binding MarR family transcriptional regulator